MIVLFEISINPRINPQGPESVNYLIYMIWLPGKYIIVHNFDIAIWSIWTLIQGEKAWWKIQMWLENENGEK